MKVLVTGLGRRRSRTVSGGLAILGFEVREAAGDADVPIQTDVVLLDCGVIDDEVLAYCRRLRRRTQAPIVAVTQRVDLQAWLRGHEAGIDDYAVQPFGLQELAARLRLSVTPGREQPAPPPTGPPQRLTAGPLVVSEGARTVEIHGTRVDLRPKEFQLLVALMRKVGRAVPREELVATLWPTGWAGAERSLEVHVASLRAKIALPGMIATVRGVGYRMVTPESFLRFTAA
ncbi:response regulator transcription factor [Catenulispora pinisilvae]|uniref:response regulator transcription factor n=1 Tax=Catenulispora pinisilvae TaxID=2705253 RepID=UPI0018917C5F|nr:response regulator transcription factor [Catenulispora pinisilvae]